MAGAGEEERTEEGGRDEWKRDREQRTGRGRSSASEITKITASAGKGERDSARSGDGADRGDCGNLEKEGEEEVREEEPYRAGTLTVRGRREEGEGMADRDEMGRDISARKNSHA